MAKLVWDQTSQKIYETGADRAVLYLPNVETGAYETGVAWNGLLGFDESPSGAEPTKLWADSINYATMYSAEEYGGTIRAYTYPDEFEQCDGSAELTTGVVIGQQNRRPFAFSYRTLVGNDTAGTDFGYKIHIVYGCMCSPSAKTHDTVNDSPSAVEFSWEITSTPVNVTGFKPTCTLEIDSTNFTTTEDKAKLTALEDVLYGSAEENARLPMPDEIASILNAAPATPAEPANPGEGTGN